MLENRFNSPVSVKECPPTITSPSLDPRVTLSTRAQTRRRLLQVPPERTFGGSGKAAKQQHSPEATAALQLDGNLQHSSKIRFKLKKKEKKKSQAVWRGSGTQKHRAGRAGKRPHLYCSGKDTRRIFISRAAYCQSDAPAAQSRKETLSQGCLLALSLLPKPGHKEVRVGVLLPCLPAEMCGVLSGVPGCVP